MRVAEKTVCCICDAPIFHIKTVDVEDHDFPDFRYSLEDLKDMGAKIRLIEEGKPLCLNCYRDLTEATHEFTFAIAKAQTELYFLTQKLRELDQNTRTKLIQEIATKEALSGIVYMADHVYPLVSEKERKLLSLLTEGLKEYYGHKRIL